MMIGISKQYLFLTMLYRKLNFGLVIRGVTTIGHGWTKSRGPPSAEGPPSSRHFIVIENDSTVCDNFTQKCVFKLQLAKFTHARNNYLFSKLPRLTVEWVDTTMPRSVPLTGNETHGPRFMGALLDILSRGPRVPSYATARNMLLTVWCSMLLVEVTDVVE